MIDLMNIILTFDHSSTTIFVPDGYVSDVEHLRACFFDWLYDNPQYMTCDEKGHTVYPTDFAFRGSAEFCSGLAENLLGVSVSIQPCDAVISCPCGEEIRCVFHVQHGDVTHILAAPRGEQCH